MAEKLDSYSPGNSYVVVHVPSEDDYSKKSFYLRTGESIESVVASAGEEFVGEDVELEFNTGTFQIDRPFASIDGILRIFPEVSPHLTYLVARGCSTRVLSLLRTLLPHLSRLQGSLRGECIIL